MTFYRNVNSGQVVEVVGEPDFLGGLARWVSFEAGPSAPEPVTEEPQVDADVATAEANLALIRPDEDDVKAAWVTYATALGVDVKGLTKAEIVALTA